MNSESLVLYWIQVRDDSDYLELKAETLQVWAKANIDGFWGNLFGIQPKALKIPDGGWKPETKTDMLDRARRIADAWSALHGVSVRIIPATGPRKLIHWRGNDIDEQRHRAIRERHPLGLDGLGARVRPQRAPPVDDFGRA